MADLNEFAKAVREQRKKLKLTQDQLAKQAGVGRLLVAKLETQKLPEVSFKKLLRILNAVGLDLRLTTANSRRPTLDDLRAEDEESGNR